MPPDFLAPPPEGWTPLSNLAASAPVPDPESEVPSTESSLLCDSMYERLRSHLASKVQPSNPGWWDDSGLADFDECGDFPAGGVVLTSVQRALRLKASQQVELCRLKLATLQPADYPTLEVASGVVNRINGAPVADSAVEAMLTEGVHVLEYFAGLCGGLEMLLRCGTRVR